MTETPIRILIVAEDSLARTGLAGVLAAHADVRVVGQSAVRGDLDVMLRAGRPDVVVWDLGWNAEASLDAMAEHASDFPPIVALLGGPEHTAEAIRSGARGLVGREADVDTLAAAVLAVWRGLRVIDPGLEPLQPGVDDRPIPPPLEPLTGRELDVLRLVAEGLPNKAIAARLGVSDHTVKFHLNAILRKLGAQSRTDAVVRATRLGLLLL